MIKNCLVRFPFCFFLLSGKLFSRMMGTKRKIPFSRPTAAFGQARKRNKSNRGTGQRAKTHHRFIRTISSFVLLLQRVRPLFTACLFSQLSPSTATPSSHHTTFLACWLSLTTRKPLHLENSFNQSSTIYSMSWTTQYNDAPGIDDLFFFPF